MSRMQFDENAEIQTGFPRKGLLQSEKKSHKNALGDLKNTIHNTPMGAIPKTPFQGRAKPIAITPTNIMNENSQWKDIRGSKFLGGGSSNQMSQKKPTKPKRTVQKGPKQISDSIDFNHLPESIFQCQDRSVAEIWAENICPNDTEISQIIQMTLNHEPMEIAPKYVPYQDDELVMPPPSPVNSADFPFEPPPLGQTLIMDLLDTAFHQLDMEE
uniref:Uncharacterized protein n=1 Tax=Lutzomyia longipalpis TaxID=7200 RepID=A0A1B0GIF3_LUTLO